MLAIYFLVGLATISTAATDESKLEGTWICVKAERDGQTSEEPVGSTIVLADGKITIHDPKRGTDEKGTYKVDDTKTPKHITLFPEKPETAGAKSFDAIYELKGDELSLCLGGPGGARPTEVSTAPDSNRSLMIFKRDKPAKK